ncbi:uncharacterized protein LOC123312233 [Coccinella septempunctata]|uniref:uncharacterized protein LOC123312233 n=1 Tax=Coccinella septempunctata TaxID=41139 RepID=UPI001D07DBAF|nr:uncharacterized protein LOC123312233 [Coccinella septempunctata]
MALRYSKPKYIAWSNDILKTMMNYPSKSDILTFCQIQLAWILKMGHHLLKIEAIRFWINEVKFHRGLRDALISCRAERILLNLIVEDSDKKIGRMASKFLQKVANKDLSRQIAGMLPFVSREPNVFSCFILTRPGVPERMEEKMLLLELLSVMIPSLAEDYVLRAACMYTNDLLENMRKEPKCLKAFSKYTSTIEFLLYATYRTEEDVSKEILFLFRNLASIQVKYHFELEATVETDPMLLLKGSTRQINRVLTIFPIILSAKVDPLLKFKDDTKLNLFYQILDFVDDVDKQENALKCLHLLIKNYDWLSFSGAIGTFVKIWCCEKLNLDRSRLFIALIVLWLRKLMKQPRHLHPMVPISEIQNFFMRSGDLNQINCCSKILRILQQDNIIKRENNIKLKFLI